MSSKTTYPIFSPPIRYEDALKNQQSPGYSSSGNSSLEGKISQVGKDRLNGTPPPENLDFEVVTPEVPNPILQRRFFSLGSRTVTVSTLRGEKIEGPNGIIPSPPFSPFSPSRSSSPSPLSKTNEERCIDNNTVIRNRLRDHCRLFCSEIVKENIKENTESNPCTDADSFLTSVSYGIAIELWAHFESNQNNYIRNKVPERNNYTSDQIAKVQSHFNWKQNKSIRQKMAQHFTSLLKKEGGARVAQKTTEDIYKSMLAALGSVAKWSP